LFLNVQPDHHILDSMLNVVVFHHFACYAV
jgi:hypothetical protein